MIGKWRTREDSVGIPVGRVRSGRGDNDSDILFSEVMGNLSSADLFSER
jgi:hypothetical protein